MHRRMCIGVIQKLYPIMRRTWPSWTSVPIVDLGTSSLQILRQLLFNFDLHFPVLVVIHIFHTFLSVSALNWQFTAGLWFLISHVFVFQSEVRKGAFRNSSRMLF